MNEELSQILRTGANEIGTPLSAPQVDKFALYLSELKRWNKKINLTSLNEDREIVVKHFLDSLTPLSHIPMGSFIMDLGSGGGLPGIPMKIARPDIRILLLDSTGKKVSFLNHMITLLKFKNARALQQRADSEVFQEIMSGHLDVVIARAFGKIEKTLEVGAPYLKVGGKLIVMKGPNWAEEKKAKCERLGLSLTDVIELVLPVMEIKRALLIYTRKS